MVNTEIEVQETPITKTWGKKPKEIKWNHKEYQIHSKEVRVKEQRIDKTNRKQIKNLKLNPNITINILNVNGINTKKQKMKRMKKQAPTIFCLQEAYF